MPCTKQPTKNNFDAATTHFGYETVHVEEKAGKVAGVFNSVSSKYDVMNDVISLGSHRIFKRFTMELSGVRVGNVVLDLAGGTGDFTKLFSPIVGSEGTVYLSDINYSMLLEGQKRLLRDSVADNVQFVQANGECLPFGDNFFDCVTIGYGIRNFTDKPKALTDILRVLKPGGRLLILEFSKPNGPLLNKGYDLYSKLWPVAGKLLVGDGKPYQYLVESIRMHPDQETFKNMMKDAGFDRVEYFNLFSGISALHRAIKP